MLPATHSVLVIFFIIGGTNGDSVKQTEGLVILPEEAPMTLNCTYQTTYSDYFFWYVQYLNKAPQLLLKGSTANPRPKEQGFQATLDTSDKTFHLQKRSVQTSDSAVYYCAMTDSDTGYALSFGKGTTLLVTPDIKNPDPAVYQLKGPKSNNISVCLYTDFQMNTTKDSEPAVFSLSRTVFNSNTTVLDMGALGSKSNGLVAWSKSTDFECQSTFQQEFYPNSGISCDAKLVEKSFETDMNLNLQNLSVMGFRIILLKMVGFNLLMTLRLWSS
nr:T cell receptor alpha chain [Sus scrofa]